MKTIHLIGIAAGMALCACGSSNSSNRTTGGSKGDFSDVATANVAEAITNPQKLKASQLGSKIAFVPLETTDSSLINDTYQITVTDSKVIVSNFRSETGVLVFDRNTGKFLNHIGQFGNGPEDFNNPYHYTDINGSRIFLRPANGNGLLIFTPDGNLCGKALEGINTFTYLNIVVNDSTIWAGGPKENNDDRGKIYRQFAMGGAVIDSVFAFKGQKLASPFPDSFSGYTDYKRYTPVLGDNMQQLVQVTNDGKNHINFQPQIYRAGNEVHLRETLCDTIYTITPRGCGYSLIFDMGSHAFPVQEINKRKPSSSDLFMTDMAENGKKVVFGISEGWPMNDDHSEYIGIYDRATGTTALGNADNGIADDISGFMPFIPSYVSTDGAFVGLISPEAVIKWLENNPGVKHPDWAGKLVADDNPVMVIISE